MSDFEVISISELAQLRKDAARYRFLRSEQSAGGVDVCVYRVEWGSGFGPAVEEMITEEEVDALVDELMAQSQPLNDYAIL